jgi:hypothetical protein
MSTPPTRSPILCQYWVEDEPSQCQHWDNSNNYCKYVRESIDKDFNITYHHADLFPTCNYIGTGKYRCQQYEGSGESGRCVVPDPYRATPRSEWCSWVAVSGTLNTTSSGTADKEASSLPLINYDNVNLYNDGKCNSGVGGIGTPGANPKCVAFSPGHLGFGRRPDFCERDDEGNVININGVKNESTPESTVSDVGMLPAGYEFLNARAKMGKCYHWPSEDLNYYVDGDGIVQAPSFQCTNKDVRITTQPWGYNEFKVDNILESIIPPCNGAKPDCPGYTGNLIAQKHPSAKSKFPYLTDRYFRCGDKILAEQILELRYNLRRQKWTAKDFKT